MFEKVILQKLEKLEKLIAEQSFLQKEILIFKEACLYLNISQSHLYKLTSTKQIPHFCPQGKKLYFKRAELDEWLLRNRTTSQGEMESKAGNYLLKQKNVKL